MIFMSRVDKPDSDDKVLETIIDEQNIQLDSLYSDALKFNVDLSLNSSVDFSELQAFRRYQAQ